MRLSFKRRVHACWLVAWGSAGVLLGVALALVLRGTLFAGAEWLAVAGALVFTAAVRRLAVLVVLALAAGMLIGLWRGTIEQIALRDYLPYYGQSVVLRGKVTEDTAYGPRGDQRLRLGDISIGGQALRGKVWVSSTSKADIKRGDYVELKGRLSEGFGNLPASMHQAQLVNAERPRPGDVAREVRDWFGAGVRRGVPEPEASLGTGYLVGQRSALPETLDEQLRIVGLTHVVVASGYNLTILVRFARRTFARISKYLATLATALMIGSFMLVTGFSPSMSRAGLVTGLSLAAWYYGRTIHPLVLLPFAAAVTALINPSYVWGDVGWYLSFTAFTGVIILAPLVQHYFWGNAKQPGVFRQIFVDTMAAQVATLPIILLAFGQYSLYALPANLLVLPLIPYTMVLTFFGGLGGLIAPGIAGWLGAPAYALLHYMTAVVGWIASLPSARGETTFGVSALIISYLALFLLTIFLWRKTGHDFRRGSIVE